jgi:hypothetical protein
MRRLRTARSTKHVAMIDEVCLKPTCRSFKENDLAIVAMFAEDIQNPSDPKKPAIAKPAEVPAS